MNYLWGMMIVIGIIYGALSGNLNQVSEQALVSAREAVSLCVTMAGIMAFWMGLMEIAENVGMIRKATQKLGGCLDFLFPDVPEKHPARKAIAANIIANIFGLGWAATPAGLLAMKELKTLLPEGTDRASPAMCDFLILNISSLQLIPVNIIAYRSQYGSAEPVRIVGPAILATFVSTVTAILFIRIRRAMEKKPSYRFRTEYAAGNAHAGGSTYAAGNAHAGGNTYPSRKKGEL